MTEVIPGLTLPNKDGSYQLKTALFVREMSHGSMSTVQTFKYNFQFMYNDNKITSMKLIFNMHSKNDIGEPVNESFTVDFTNSDEFLQRIKKAVETTNYGNYEFGNYKRCVITSID